MLTIGEYPLVSLAEVLDRMALQSQVLALGNGAEAHVPDESGETDPT